MMMLRMAGLFLITLGIMWAMQGAGLIGWPADSFMLGRGEWVVRGIVTVTAGAALLGFVQYRQRR